MHAAAQTIGLCPFGVLRRREQPVASDLVRSAGSCALFAAIPSTMVELMGSLIAVLDVAYAGEAAGVGCVLAEGWTAPAPVAEITKRLVCSPARYEPGRFYQRELPLLQAIVDRLESRPAVFVIDGYVWLGTQKEPGLGAHLFASVGRAIPVVGVAKTPFRNDTWSARVLRGASRRPLFVTAAGLDQTRAAGLVVGMHGKHRIPTLLQRADHLARAAADGSE